MRLAAYSAPTVGLVAAYVIGLVTELVGEEPEREKRFDWALGDASAKTGRTVRLPFDAVWERRRLIVEVDEDQHRRPVEWWDKPTVMTVTGVHRGEQRRIYDERKRTAARSEGYTVVEIPWERRPPPAKRNRSDDLRAVRALLYEAGVRLE